MCGKDDCSPYLWQHNPMITAGTYPPIDPGKDEPGMTLQYRDAERGYVVWRDYTVDGEVVKSPVDSGKSSDRFATVADGHLVHLAITASGHRLTLKVAIIGSGLTIRL